MRKSGSLHLCANPAEPPYSIWSDRNDLPGFQIELAEAVAHAMGLGLVVDWERNPGNAAKCDASMDVVVGAKLFQPEGITGPLLSTLIPLRLTKPYAGSGVFLAVTAGSAARRFEDFQAQKIGVVAGTVAYQYLASAGLNVSVLPSRTKSSPRSRTAKSRAAPSGRPSSAGIGTSTRRRR